jgi:hypothetical protein
MLSRFLSKYIFAEFIVLEVTLGNLAGAYGTERMINEAINLKGLLNTWKLL